MSESAPQSKYRLSIRRPVTVTMLFLSLLVFGWKSYQELPINLMPDISYPTLTVRTEYEGAAPEDVEELVTEPLEERLSVVSGVVEISSISSAGLSEVILEFTWGTDMNLAIQGVRESLDLFVPPQGLTQRPIILRFDPTLDPVMRVAITGSDLGNIADPSYIADPEERERRLRAELTQIREAAERQIKPDLEAEAGIAQVVVKGGREEEIQILVDSERLKSLNISLDSVARSLEQQNINLSGGSLKDGKTEYLVRTLNEFKGIEEIAGVILRTPTGEQLRLDDVASVGFGEKERETVVRVNGQEAVALDIYKEGDANTVQVGQKLKDFFGFERKRSLRERLLVQMAERGTSERAQEMLREMKRRQQLTDRLSTRLPDYHKTFMISDQSRFIQASVREVQQTAILGGLLALVVLYLFLRELKSTVIIGIAIPISVVATFIPMFMLDVSLNIMSLGGLALGVGMLVDNSIVVLESIFRCAEEGDDPLDAAERGTEEVAGAVTASTLTTIAVFFPLVFVEGIAGQLFRDLALTVTFSLLASLLVALYLIPMIASRRAVNLSSRDQVIWLLRAYTEIRRKGQIGRLSTLLAMPKRGLEFGGQWFRETYGEIMGPVMKGLKGIGGQGSREVGLGGWSLRAVCAAALPFVAALFIVQTAIKIVATVAATAVFLVSLLAMGNLWFLAKLFRALFYIPLSVFDRCFRAIRGVYVVVLRQSLHLSPVVLAVVALLALHAGYVALSLGRELIPPLKQGEFGIRIEAPPGTRLEVTEMRARRVEEIIRELDERTYKVIESITIEAGSEKARPGSDEGENIAHLTVKLKNPKENARRQDEIMEAMRQKIKETINDEIAFTLPTLFSFKTAIELQVFGENLEELRVLGKRAKNAIETIDGIRDAELSLKPGYPEVIIEMDRDLLAEKGLSPGAIANRIRTEVQGEVPTFYSRGAQKIPIRVRADQAGLNSLADIRSLSIVDGSTPISLGSVAKIWTQEGPSEIRRIDQRQIVLITANVEGIDLGSVSREVQDRMDEVLGSGNYILGGQNRELQTSYEGLSFALFLAVFLVYVVMACQFESLWHPALIMFSVPLAFIGVIYVLDRFSINLSVVVFIGGIVLAGIVVNGAIILVDYINRLRARGMPKVDAIVEAGKIRFRPILMTTTTTVLGLIPMALSGGEGAEIRRPMAITVMAGLGSATVLTLLVIPVVYNFFSGRDRAQP